MKNDRSIAERALKSAGPSTRRLNPHIWPDQTGCLAPSTEQQRDSKPEPLAEDAREAAHKIRRLVRVKSFRFRLLDERNLFEKHFVDALVEAGVLFDDSSQWAKVEVSQEQVTSRVLERTEIEIEDLGPRA